MRISPYEVYCRGDQEFSLVKKGRKSEAVRRKLNVVRSDVSFQFFFTIFTFSFTFGHAHEKEKTSV